MTLRADLFISKGLFPENLPPVFTSHGLTAAFNDIGPGYAVTRNTVGDMALYNASKRGGQRRLFKIPHPLFIRDQAIFFERHWPDIDRLLARSTGSKSRPQFYEIGPRHVRLTGHAELPRLKLQALSRFRYCLVTDVARFFPSVYTHSLPWAINGKSAAKIDNNSNSAAVFGNKLDLILRQSQSKQTVGIAVGPDASKVVAEILMSSVDHAFSAKSGEKKPVFVRHVDDYFVGGHTIEECERHLTTLRAALRDHELDVNETKTKIISTKYVFGDDWPTSFSKDLRRALAPRPLWAIDADDDLLSILSKIVDQATAAEDDGIIRHCIRIIDEQKAWAINWEILEHFLAQCAVQFPHAIDYVARVVVWRLTRGLDIDRELWTEVAITTVEAKALAGHDSETVWALWLLKELGITLPASLASMVIQNSNSLIQAFVAHFGRHRRIAGRKWKKALLEAVGDNPLAGAHWPLSLELHHLGYAPVEWLSGSPPEAIAAPHRKRLSVINWSARLKGSGDAPEGPEDQPEHALEDYGDDYGNFREDKEPEGGEDDEKATPDVSFLNLDEELKDLLG